MTIILHTFLTPPFCSLLEPHIAKVLSMTTGMHKQFAEGISPAIKIFDANQQSLSHARTTKLWT